MLKEIKNEMVFFLPFHRLRFERGQHRGTHKVKIKMVIARLDIIVPESTVQVLIYGLKNISSINDQCAFKFNKF